jgi:hypothetical protein
MPAAIGPRFVLEAGFLILLAVVVGFADLSPALIILVMAVAWLLVAMIEYFAWRQGPRMGMSTAAAVAEPAPVPAAPQEEVVQEMAPPPPPPPPAPAESGPTPTPPEEQTMSASGSEPDPEAVPEEERPAEFLAAPPERERYSLEPLQPRPRRRWVVFGPRDRPEAPPEGASEEER